MNPNLGPWIRTMIAAGAVSVELRHLSLARDGDETSAVVYGWALGADTDPEQIATDATTLSHEDAADTGGPQKYALIALAATEAGGRSLGRKVWRVAGERLHEAGTPSEPANAAGVVAMVMRHYEADKRYEIQRTQMFLGAMTALHSKAFERLEKLEEREMSVLELMERLHSGAHDRDIAKQREERTMALQARALDKVEPLVPVILSKMLKMPLAPAGSESGLDALLKSLDHDQIDKLIALLRPEQQIVLQELWRERVKAEAERDAKDAPKAAEGGAA